MEIIGVCRDQHDWGTGLLEGIVVYEYIRKEDQWLITNGKEHHSHEFGCFCTCWQWEAVEGFWAGQRYKLLAFLLISKLVTVYPASYLTFPLGCVTDRFSEISLGANSWFSSKSSLPWFSILEYGISFPLGTHAIMPLSRTPLPIWSSFSILSILLVKQVPNIHTSLHIPCYHFQFKLSPSLTSIPEIHSTLLMFHSCPLLPIHSLTPRLAFPKQK